ncbi:MAG TPA: aldo/keto reductase [Anaerolineales bacterium]|nr:aldo/keto reductase [Anaerolineales bacterium]
MNNSLEKIDPGSVLHRKLYTGAEIPAVGLGTFGSDRFTATEIAEAVFGAADIGYRHFDCAAVYGNEKEIGVSFQKILSSGIRRDELWITSKLWNDKHAEEDVIPACQQTLKDLQLEYLDLYLIHWPFPNHHAPGVDVDSRDPHAVPYIHENYMKTWRQMEKLVELGLVRHIGTSNMTIPKLKLLVRDAKIKPAANEMELHPHFQQSEFFKFCMENQIAPIGFAPIGSPTRPDRDKTPDDTVDIEDPVIVKIAQRLNVHPAVICVKWAVQRGQIPIPFSIRPNEYWSNLKAAVSEPLTEEEMQAIAAIDKNNRLIKGQVFLWESAKDWHDLWDLDGQIVSA